MQEWVISRNSKGEVILRSAFGEQYRIFDSTAHYREWWGKDGGWRYPSPRHL